MPLYNFLMVLLTPFFIVWIYIRCLLGKEDKHRIKERFGLPSISPQKGVIWFHGASIGETQMLLPLMRFYSEQGKICLITSGTRNSANRLKKQLGPGMFHQYIPLDNPLWIKRFMRSWSPQCVIWAESDLWPCILQKVSQHIPIYLLNARLSEKSQRFWLLAPFFLRHIANFFTKIYPQSTKYLQVFQKLGLKNIRYIGNAKTITQIPHIDNSVNKIFTENKRFIWVAANTHKGEEGVILETYKALRHLHIILCLIPRHPERREEVKAMIDRLSLNVTLRSSGSLPEEGTDVYLVDTLGELSSFYSIADAIFLGGSLLKDIGGHNPLEATYFSRPLLVGPHIQNNASLYDKLFEKKAIEIVHTAKDMTHRLHDLVVYPERREMYTKRLSSLESVSIEQFMALLQEDIAL